MRKSFELLKHFSKISLGRKALIFVSVLQHFNNIICELLPWQRPYLCVNFVKLIYLFLKERKKI